MMRPFFLCFVLILCLTGCANRPSYPTLQGTERCENGVQDPDEYGVDCGWSCLNDCPDLRTLEGEIFRRYPLDARYRYLITGPLIIRDQGELVIQPGMNVKVQANVGAYIAVVQGGSIFAYGNKNNPITISSNAAAPEAGDWGGIILCGKAPIGQDSPQLSPLGYYFYGGDRTNDTSGFLRYLKIEHAGAPYNESVHFNALSLYGVGQYTSIQNLWINESLHHGMMANGGSFSMEEVLITESGNTGAVFSPDWSGQWEGLYVHNSQIGLSYPVQPSQTNAESLSLLRTAIVAADEKGISITNHMSLQQFEQLYIAQTPMGVAFNAFSGIESEEDQPDFRFETVSRFSNEAAFNSWFENSASLPFSNADSMPIWINSWED